MKSVITPTLAVCLAAGLAAGIALARPRTEVAVPPPAPVASPAPASVPVPDPAGAPGADAPQHVPTEPIEIRDFGFNRVTVPAGSVVEVRNVDGVDHTVTADDGSFDTGLVAGGGAATFVAPSRPGAYPFSCALHPSMTGELVVT